MEYDKITALHYAAYRPALHGEILRSCLGAQDKRSWGLDVGCGTGHSAVALAQYCEGVIGIDPSRAMLARAIEHPRVTYALQAHETLDLADNRFDLATFAGSLHYAKSQNLIDEVVRVCKKGAQILVYDFELLLDHIITSLIPEGHAAPPSTYDHRANFSGLDQSALALEKELQKPFSVPMAPSELAHVFLSVMDTHGALLERFGRDKLFQQVAQRLHALLKAEPASVGAMAYATLYRVTK